MIFSLVPSSVVASAAEFIFTAPEQMTVTSLSSSNIAPGITQDNLITRDKETGAQTKSFIAKIDQSVLYGESKSAGFLAGYSDYKMEPGKWKMATVRDQAAACEKETGKNIVFAMNADFFNMQTGQPSGLLVMNGKELCSALNAEGNPREAGYFGLTKDGEYVLRDGNVDASDIVEGIGSPYWIIRDGRNVMGRTTESTALMPRGAVGLTADNSLIFIVSDGRQAPKSTGICEYDVADILLSYGCVNALYLDGGGSATFASKSEGTNELTVKNSPSDGIERRVSSSLFIYSTAKASGEFDHASITPANDLYTPGSEVQFEAIGVDSVGGKATLPADGKFALDETSNDLGTVTEDGKFVSNGKTGTVKVNYISGEKVCGSTTIEIVVPDTLFVSSKEQAVGPGVVTDFGIVAKNKDRDVIMKNGDLVWSIVDSETGRDLTDEAGKFDGLNFTGAEDGTYNALITAKFNGAEDINLELTVFIGSKQVSFYNFEYTTDKEEAEKNPDLEYIASYTLPQSDNTGRDNFKDFVEGGTKQALYDAGYPLYTWTAALPMEGAKATVVSSVDGEPVRFGSHSLRIDFDYSNYDHSSNSNVYIRGTVPDYNFEGKPTAIGAWVYSPEGTNHFPIYLNCANKGGDWFAYQMVGKLDWTGWKYVEFDLTGKTTTASGTGGVNEPFGMYQGCGIFWISYQEAAVESASADTVYIDDLNLIYGANTTDTINPEVSYIGNVTDEIVDGETVYTSNTNTFKAVYADVEDKYMSGINDDLTKMYIDGVDVTGKCYNAKEDGTIYYYDAFLADGVHSIEVKVTDNYGNETSKISYFTVKGDVKETTVEFAALNAPVLGKNYDLVIRTNNPEDVVSADIDVKILSKFANYWKDIKVEPSENYVLDGEAKYDSVKRILSFKADRKADADPTKDDGIIAKIVTKVPTDTPEALEVTHRIAKGELTYKATENKPLNGFSGKVTKECEASLIIDCETAVVGAESTTIHVTTFDGKPAAGRKIYKADGTLLGETDAEGKLVTDAFVGGSAEHTIYAEGENERSFNVKVKSLLPGGNEDGTPSFVKLNGSADAEESQNISWMSSPLTSADKAVVKFAEKTAYEKDGEKAFSEKEGTSTLNSMASSGKIETSYAVRVNRANLEGLKADTEYVYCVGDGEKFSEVKSFTTKKNGASTNFFVIGDTQAANTDNTDSISKQLVGSGVKYDFGIQTGDMVDNGGDYTMWANIAKIFSGDYLGTVPVVHVLGNHESYGDLNGTNAAHYFNLPETQGDKAPLCYSVQYGNVYIAVINYGVASDYKEAAEWIKADAAKTTAQWKILTSHQPAYTTNPSGTSQAVMDVLRTLCDEAKFDVMFSGHDHTFARTKAMTGGEINENGTTYYICGSTGEKGYDPVINKDYNFEIVRGKSTDITQLDGFNAVYLTVSADDKQLVIKAHDVNGDNDEVIDTFTKTADNDCSKNGHEYLYTADGYLTCGKCGYTIKQTGYTGLVRDEKTKRAMFLDNGAVSKSKWETVGDDSYYFDENGLAVTGKVMIPTKMNPTIDTKGEERDVEYTFDENGKFVKGSFVKETVTGAPERNLTGSIKNDKANLTKEVIRYYEAGGSYAVNWRQIDGNWYFFLKFGNTLKNDNGDMYRRGLKGEMRVQTPGKNFVGYYRFDTDGIMKRGALVDDLDSNGNLIGTRYYWADEYVVDKNVEYDGFTYSFGKDGYMNVKPISECRTKTSSLSVTYTGSAIKPTVTITDGKQTLAGCSASEKDDTKAKYNYTVEYVGNTDVGEGSVIIKGNPSRGYSGTVVLALTVNRASASGFTVTGINSSYAYTGKSIAPSVKVAFGGKTLVKDKDYTVTYSNNTKIGTASVKISGKGSFTSSKTVTFKIIPANVTGFKATSAPSSVKLTWLKVAGATGYRVYQYDTSKKGWKTIAETKDSSYTVKNLTPGTSYKFAVRAFAKSGSTTYFSASYPTATARPTLAAVTNLKASASTTSVKLTWSKVAGAAGYRVYKYNTKTKKYEKVADTKNTSFTVSGLKVGTSYKFAVRAYSKNGGTTYWSVSYPQVTAKALPSTVTNFKASASTTSVKLTWSKVAGATGYRVYQYNTKTKKYEKVADTKSTSYTVSGLKVGTSYKFAVRAYSKNGSAICWSAAYPQVTAKTLPSTVTNFKGYASSKSVKLTWNKVAGATGYRVYVYSTKTKKYSIVANTKGTTYTVSGLKAGTSYRFAVRAYTKSGSTAYMSPSYPQITVKTKRA